MIEVVSVSEIVIAIKINDGNEKNIANITEIYHLKMQYIKNDYKN